jgi:hypothetical protein
MIFFPTVYEFVASSSSVKLGVFIQDLTKLNCFKTLLPDHTVAVFITGASRYAYQVISKYGKGDNL